MIDPIPTILLFLVMAISVVGSAIFIIRIIKGKAEDLIDLSENNTRIGLAIYTNFLYFLFIFFQIYSVLSSSNFRYGLQIELLFIAVAIFPLAALIISYLNLERGIKRKSKLSPKSFDNGEQKKTEECINIIANRLFLKKNPKILISSDENISPFVFGRKRKKSYICFPSNWGEVLDKLSSGNEGVRDKLRFFIIGHELSHIKNGDHIFIGTAQLFFRTFKYYALTEIAVLAFYFSSPDLSLHSYYLSISMLFGLIYYFILFMLTLSVSRHREYVADARVSTITSESELNQIIEGETNYKISRLSPFEYMLKWFSDFSSHRLNALSISASIGNITDHAGGWAKTIFQKTKLFTQKILSTHPEPGNRQMGMKLKYYSGRSRNTISKESSIWIGIISALIYNIPAFHPKTEADLFFSQENSFFLVATSLTSLLYFAFIAISISLVFSITMRSAVSMKISFLGYLVDVLVKYTAVFFSFCTTSIVLVLFSSVFAGNTAGEGKISERLSADLSSILQIISVSFILTILLFLASKTISHKNMTILKERKREILFFLGFLGYFGFFILSALKPPDEVLYVLIILAVLVGISSISKSWFGSSERILKHSSFQKSWRATYWLVFFIPLLLFTFLITRPFGRIGIRDSIFDVPETYFFIIAVAYIVYRIRYRKAWGRSSILSPESYLEGINEYVYVLRIIGSKKLREIKEWIRDVILSYRVSDGQPSIKRIANLSGYYAIYGYIQCGGFFKDTKSINSGSTFSTYGAIHALSQINLLTGEVTSETTDYVLFLENPDGGFPPAEGLPSMLVSTYHALEILSKYNKKNMVDIETNSEWIKSLQRERGYFDDGAKDYPKIEQTFFALNSLKRLKKLDVIDKKRCIEWVKSNLKDNDRSCESIFFSLKCLQLLRELNSGIKEEVKTGWLLPYRHYLSDMDIDKNLSIFYYFFKVAEIVMDDKEEIKTLLPDLEERAYQSLVQYLKGA